MITTPPILALALTRPVEGNSPVMDSLHAMWTDFLRSLPNFGVALGALLVTAIVATGVSRLLELVLGKTKVRSSLCDLFRQLSFTLIWFGGILVASVLAFPGVTVGKIMTVLGLGSIAIGFAFKDIFENFFAGILILWRFPFETGDFIEVGDVEGAVERTTIRMTEIRRTDGQVVVLPNSVLFKNPVLVKTARELRRIGTTCGVAYGENVDEARSVIHAAVSACPTVSTAREVQVFAREFGSSSIDFEVAWWTGSEPIAERRSRDEVVASIKHALDEAGIEIPFPYRTLTFHEPLPVRQWSNHESEPDSKHSDAPTVTVAAPDR